MQRLLLAAAAMAAMPAACGYHLVDPSAAGGGRRMSVPVADNETRWRGLESNLTSALRADAQRLLDVRLGEDPPDLVLSTEIRYARRDAPVRERSGGAALGAVTLEVAWRLEDAGGNPLDSGTVLQTLEFLPSEEEVAETALVEMLDSMAEMVVIEVGTRLAGRSGNT